MLFIRFLRVAAVFAVSTAVVLSAQVNAAAQRPPAKKSSAKTAAKAVAKARARQGGQAKAAILKLRQNEAAAQANKPEKTAAKSAAKSTANPLVANRTTKTTAVAATTPSKSSVQKRAEPPLPMVTAVDFKTAAAEIDRKLAAEIPAINSPSAAAQAGDEVYLRRVSIDIAGRLPTPGEITAFALDPASDKRTRAVERLLAEEAYGHNWGRYWRDVILYRRTEDRALVVSQSLEEYLAAELNKNTPWDAIAREFITATGDVRENGATAIFMAQMGETSDVTAEISRIFTGIQIQCAQCHNHPTDRWQRTQFHELAAFFPRIAVRPKRDVMPATFEVASADNAPRVRRPNATGRGSREHYMPDLNNPQAQGTLMRPVFFVTGQALSPGLTDTERRKTIADWITSRENPWFDKAFVNRMWSELVGEGFYEPVDDIGPDRQCAAPATLDYLAAQFAAHKHDIKWLISTITATAAYQRESRSRRGPEETPMLANVSQRLRGDQLYSAITSVLGTPPSLAGGRGGRFGNNRDPRAPFNAIFGFDPSVRRDEVAGSIPQALAVMNSPQLATGINSGRRGTLLGRLLSDAQDNEAVAVDLYLRTLSREPTDDELKTCLAHVKDAGSRSEGFEDLLWALLNSAEFMHRR
jgi:hypothetical protein